MFQSVNLMAKQAEQQAMCDLCLPTDVCPVCDVVGDVK